MFLNMHQSRCGSSIIAAAAKETWQLIEEGAGGLCSGMKFGSLKCGGSQAFETAGTDMPAGTGLNGEL